MVDSDPNSSGIITMALALGRPDPDVLPLPRRGPTQAQLRTWERFRRGVTDLNSAVLASRLQNENLGVVVRFAYPRGISVTLLSDLDKRNLAKLEANASQLRGILRDVEDRRLGVAFRDNDLDILATPDTPGEVVDSYSLETLGIIWPLAIGAAVLVAGIAVVRYLMIENDKISKKLSGVLTDANRKLCADPNSDLCADWKRTREIEHYDRRESVVSTIKSSIKTIGAGARAGLELGIAGLLLWGAYQYFGKRKPG